MSSTSTPPPPPPPAPTTTKTHTDQHLHTQWQAQQDHLRASIITQDTFPIESLTLIGGVDLSFFDAPSNTHSHTHTHNFPSSSSSSSFFHHALACLVILTYPQLEVVYESFLSVCVSVPYTCGFLAFREAPPLMELMEKLRREMPELVPQVCVGVCVCGWVGGWQDFGEAVVLSLIHTHIYIYTHRLCL